MEIRVVAGSSSSMLRAEPFRLEPTCQIWKVVGLSSLDTNERIENKHEYFHAYSRAYEAQLSCG